MTRSQTRQNNNSANAKDNTVVITAPRRSPRLVGRYQVRRSLRLNPHLQQVEDETPITMDIVEVRRRSERIKQSPPVDYLKLSGENSFSEQNDLADPQDYLELDLDEDYNPKYDLSVIVDDEDDEEAEYIHHRLSELAASPLSERRYDANIDFDVASVAWRRNKRPIGNGMFAYRSRTN